MNNTTPFKAAVSLVEAIYGRQWTGRAVVPSFADIPELKKLQDTYRIKTIALGAAKAVAGATVGLDPAEPGLDVYAMASFEAMSGRPEPKSMDAQQAACYKAGRAWVFAQAAKLKAALDGDLLVALATLV